MSEWKDWKIVFINWNEVEISKRRIMISLHCDAWGISSKNLNKFYYKNFCGRPARIDCMEHYVIFRIFFVRPEVELWWTLTSQSLPTWDILRFYVQVLLFLPYPFPLKYLLWKFSWKKSFDIHSFWYFSVVMWPDDPQVFSEVHCESLEDLELLESY